ncbi:MAG: hypothetical protein U0Q11_04545 [Vicinamibacterales bacterium]
MSTFRSILCNHLHDCRWPVSHRRRRLQPPEGGSAASSEKAAVLSLNTATASELEHLPGIGQGRCSHRRCPDEEEVRSAGRGYYANRALRAIVIEEMQIHHFERISGRLKKAQESPNVSRLMGAVVGAQPELRGSRRGFNRWGSGENAGEHLGLALG